MNDLVNKCTKKNELIYLLLPFSLILLGEKGSKGTTDLSFSPPLSQRILDLPSLFFVQPIFSFSLKHKKNVAYSEFFYF